MKIFVSILVGIGALSALVNLGFFIFVGHRGGNLLAAISCTVSTVALLTAWRSLESARRNAGGPR